MFTCARSAVAAKALAQVLPRQIDAYALPTRKPECIQVILNALSADTDFSEVVTALSSNQKQTISAIVFNPKLTLDRSRYQAIYGAAPSLPRSRSYSSGNLSLLAAFLSSYCTIPSDLAARLRPLVPAPKQPTAAYQPGEPPVDENLWVHATEQAACHNVLAVLSLIDQKAVKVSATTGQLTDGGAKLLLAALLAGDYYTPEQQPEYHARDVGVG